MRAAKDAVCKQRRDDSAGCEQRGATSSNFSDLAFLFGQGLARQGKHALAEIRHPPQGPPVHAFRLSCGAVGPLLAGARTPRDADE